MGLFNIFDIKVEKKDKQFMRVLKIKTIPLAG